MLRGTANAVLKAIDKKLLTVSAVLVAAGSSSRMNGTDKLFADLLGEPVLATTLKVFQQSRSVQEIVLVVKKEWVEQAQALCRMHGADKVTTVLAGGATRSESSGIGLGAVTKKADIVLIHDGDRPFVDQDMIFRTVDAAAKWGAATAAIPVSSTIKRGKEGAVTETVSRDGLFEIQTPQAFQADLLKAARKRAGKEGKTFTDDCAFLENMGIRPVLVDGSRLNLKITYPEDLVLARAIAGMKEG